MDTPSDSVHSTGHSLFGHWKTVFKGRKMDKDTPLIAPKSSTSVITANPDAKCGPANSKYDISQPSNHNTKGFWQMEYEGLTESNPNSITIVEATKAQYKEKKRIDSIGATADWMLNAVLSLQDVVNKITKFDPTRYAPSAWAIISLGLT
ncbi:hypothetical protein BDQ94DRAFT_163531 [Aspergillus welwitschiae]|uniref:Uncharacterized protein n=1 Tax=Aspergillus welwitschiae TaxID=1341132 RepID=A0A3F3PKT3_9EURO|nr:hypothetical protein BDQ94DRAFT_163531 [Aspergillus welwitschiae]RDH27545.1 hypothetical protein BDQ94DRAFT_163531 [Aspergillus welwitschiae]